jgi:hypothetical protein
MARREAPRGFERDHGHDKNNGCATWRAIPLALSEGCEGETEDEPTRGLDKEYGRRSVG